MFSSAARTIVSRAAASAASRGAVANRLNVQPSMMAVRFASTFLNPAEVQERIITVVKNFDKCDPAKVSSDSKFVDDLGLDSLDSVEVVMAIEDEFAIEIPDAEADRIASIGDAVEYIAAHPMAK
ncbi:acyl carrier protein [Skeletonema marinoi]|uniref:Acyl carrier protein n=1 Tax=Skeletonema marinoi TaxID=267567 RepID=A0AAD9D873_9STRA|nr:acyl carrier protein [Skeletonema marinoi]|mmetsp:Transcript_27149/g.54298  ORF Transcript_27149/g.54298 Transcript_27149/m.54298 type:complete len:125 (-) Transcript_27149:214-588(-)